jgi:predicted transcriptional regulator
MPDGTVVYLMPVAEDDGLDDEERAALHESIEASEQDIAAGRTVPAERVMARLRAKL